VHEILKDFDSALQIYEETLAYTLEKIQEANHMYQQYKNREEEEEKGNEKEMEEEGKEKGKEKEKEKEKEEEKGKGKEKEEELHDNEDALHEEPDQKGKNIIRLWYEIEHHLRFNIASVHLEQEKKEQSEKGFLLSFFVLLPVLPDHLLSFPKKNLKRQKLLESEYSNITNTPLKYGRGN